MVWYIHDSSTPNDFVDYGVNSPLFTIEMWHGGSFQWGKNLCYVGGAIDYVDYCDVETLTKAFIVEIARQVGVSTVKRIWFKRCFSSFNTDLAELTNDNEAKQLVNCIDVDRVVKVYIDETDSGGIDFGNDTGSDSGNEGGDKNVDNGMNDKNEGGDKNVDNGMNDKAAGWVPSWNGVDGYEVVGPGGEAYAVSVALKTCGCQRWQLNGLPCNHACAAINYMRRPVASYVNAAYRRATYLKTYTHVLQPMNGKILWPKADRPVVLAPPIHRGVGRPPKIRRKDPTENKEEMEKKRQKKQNDNKKVMSRVGSRIKCGLCKQEGHNRSTCGRTSSYVYKYRGRGKNRVGATDVEELNLVDEFDGIDFEADLEGDNIAQTGNGGVGDTGNSGVGDTGNENEGDNAAGNEGTENNVNMDENEDTDLGPIWGRDGEGPSEMVVDIELWNELATQDEHWNLQTQESTTIPDFAKGTGSAILPDSEAGDALNTVEKIAGKKTKSQILTTKLSAQTSVEKTCAKSAQTNSKVLATKERAIEPPPNANVTKAHATRTKKVQTSQQSEALSGPQSDTQHSSKQVVADKGKKTQMEVMAKRASLGLRNIVPKHPKAPAEHITLDDYEEHYDPQAKEMIVEPSTVQEQEQPEASHAGIHQAYTGPKRLGKGHILKKGKEYKTIATLLSEKKNEIAERKKKEAENKKEIVENKKKLAEKKKIEAEKKKRKN